MIHVKSMVVDGLWSVVGSTNFDHRSFEVNDEVNLAILDPAIAVRISEDFHCDLKQSRQVTYKEWREQRSYRFYEDLRVFGQTGMTRFRIATYNVHKCRGIDWRVDPARIAKVIREMNVDIVALQEVVADHVQRIAGQAGMSYTFGAARQWQGEDYGNAVLSRFPIRGEQNYDVSIGRREQRRCLRVDLEFPAARTLHVFGVHLGTSFFERRHQARKLLSGEILQSPELTGPRLLLGDFNEWSRGLVTQTLSRYLESADIREHLKRSRTYPGVMPFLHLDHIYYDSSLQLTEMHLHRTATSLAASDHLPLIGDFHLRS
jgi:endonuclease/exonuclease/phosphatase family metal-dependent hydrolase